MLGDRLQKVQVWVGLPPLPRPQPVQPAYLSGAAVTFPWLDIPDVCLGRRRESAAPLVTSPVPYSVKVWLEVAEQPTQFRV